MIIDPHVHIGHDTTFESNRTEDEVYNKMKEVGINAAIIQPAQFVTFEDYKYCHNRIYDFHLKHPKEIFGMFSLNPHWDVDLYKNEARRCVKELGFVGVKLTPLTHIANAAVKRTRLPFEICRELNVTLMIHQGLGIPFSLSSTFFDLIREFNDVNIVLAHCGTMDNEDEAIVLAKEFDNVFLEISVRTPNIRNIKLFVKEIGSGRIMYASDSPTEMAHVIWEVKNSGISKEDQENILWKAAAKAFKLERRL
ncbi:MAG: amidohydrolase family protein [Bacillota bacterium]|jgi:predicted TIM-barrel fold metal-dependent hydrolase|nr:amidohydrolase family protein [Bacillota bacterium]NLP22589.1 amidohydrolase family protein [Erysipelotrichaceae bacterium]